MHICTSTFATLYFENFRQNTSLLKNIVAFAFIDLGWRARCNILLHTKHTFTVRVVCLWREDVLYS